MNPFDIVKSLCEKTDLEYSIQDYNPWIINRVMSLYKDCIFFANELNKNYSLDKEIQRDFYLYGITKGKRFAKWIKKDKDELVEFIAKHYNVNLNIAKQYLQILTERDIEELQSAYQYGFSKSKKE